LRLTPSSAAEMRYWQLWRFATLFLLLDRLEATQLRVA
jgi:hypothetical protein